MRIQPFIIALALAGCATEPELDTDDIDTGQIESESSVYQWAFRGYPNQMSEWQVGMTYFNGRLHMVHNGHGTPNELWRSSFDGTRWSTNVKLPSTHRSTGGPALTVHGGQLKMIYRAAGQNRLMMSASLDGNTYGTPVTIGSYLGTEQLVSEPSATVFGGQLYVGYCTAHALRVDRFNGASWSLVYKETYASNATCEHVELAVVPDDGALHAVVATITDFSYGDPAYLMRDLRTFTGTSWAGSGQSLTMKTKQPISITTCNGITHMTHGGYSDGSEIWWAERMNGAWTTDFRVPGRYSWGGAALGCFGSRAIMVYPNTSGSLEWLEFGP